MTNAESAAAYRSTQYVRGDQQRVVLEALESHPGGLIREEICDVTTLKTQSVTARISELVGMGLVTKKRRSTPDAQGRWYETRLTSSGRPTAVLILARG